MKIEASQDTIILKEDLKNDVALVLEWNDAANRGENTKIIYFFKMDIANNNFESSIPKKELEPDQRSIEFSHEDLNNLIINYWQKTPGQNVDIEAEVIAEVVESSVYMKPEITKITLNITSYAPIPKDLFLFGSATGNNDPNKAEKLEMKVFNKDYIWKGNLEVETFKFIESLGKLLPSINKGDDEYTLIRRINENDPDNQFTVEESGLHSIYINRENMSIVHSYLPFENVWMVGSATPANWDINNPTPMHWDYKNPGIFIYEGTINAGEMKFPLKVGDWQGDYLMPVEANAGIDDNRVQFVKGGEPDYKWLISEADAGDYKMTLDVFAMTITFEKI